MDGDRLTGRNIASVVVILTGTFVAMLNNTLLNPALPSIMADHDATAGTVQWLASGYTLAIAVVIPLSAYLLGRFRASRLFMGALSVFLAGSLLVGWGPSFPVLLVGRILQGLCVGVLLPMNATLVVLTLPKRRRGMAMGLVALALGVAPAVGPTIAGLLIDSVGWHVMFLLLAPIAAILIVVGRVFLESPARFERIGLDAPSLALSTAGLICLLLGFGTFAEEGLRLVAIALAVVGTALIALFVRRQGRLEQPLLRVAVLRIGPLAINVSIVFLMLSALMGISLVIPLYIQNTLGLSATVNGLVLLPGAALSAAMSMVAGTLYDKIGVRGLAIGGCLACIVGAIGMALLAADSSPLVLMACYLVFVTGLLTSLTALNTWGIASLPDALVQHGNAVTNTVNQVGSAFGMAFMTSMTTLGSSLAVGSAEEVAFAGQHCAFVTVAVIVGICLVAVIVFARDHERGLYDGE